MATNCLRRIISRKSSPIAKELRFFSSWSVMYLHVMYSHQWKQTNIVFKSICQRQMEKFYFQYVILKVWDNGCCRNVTALLYQFYEYKEIDLKIAPAQKTCTGVPQKWNIPEEAKNGEATQSAFTCSKFNNRNTRTYFTPCSSVSNVNIEHVLRLHFWKNWCWKGSIIF